MGGGKGCMAINHITGLLLEWGVDIDRSIRAAQWSERCSRHSSRFTHVIYALYAGKVSFIVIATFIGHAWWFRVVFRVTRFDYDLEYPDGNSFD